MLCVIWINQACKYITWCQYDTLVKEGLVYIYIYVSLLNMQEKITFSLNKEHFDWLIGLIYYNADVFERFKKKKPF